MKELTYQNLLEALYELSPEQLQQPIRIVKGRKLLPVQDVALSCECAGPAVKQVGENYPLIIT